MVLHTKESPKCEQKKTIKKPLLLSVLLTLLQLVFPVFSGTIISILQLNELMSRAIQAVFFLLAGIVACLIAKRMFGSLYSVGLRPLKSVTSNNYLLFLPIVFIELSSLAFGLREGLSALLVFVFFVFTVAVGFSEELYFRGLIPNLLMRKNLLVPLLLSSFLFSVGHFFNLLAGAGLVETIFQVVFAFLFGIVALEIRLLTGSLVVPIVWHILHNFISLVTKVNDSGSMLFGVLQGTVLFFYAIYLWKKYLLHRTVEENHKV